MDPVSSLFNKKKYEHPLNWLLGVVFFSILFAFGWSGIHSRNKQPLHLIVYAFSTQEEVLPQGVFPAFEQVWKAEIEPGLGFDTAASFLVRGE